MPKATFDNRQEYTDSRGKLFHSTVVAQDTGNTFVDMKVEHVGSWLTCDACNPVWPIDGNADDTLAGLRWEFAEASKEAKAAAERLEAVKAKLKARLQVDGATRTALHVNGFRPLLLTYSENWTLDSKALKAEHPGTWVAYAKQGTRWTISEGKAEQ